MIFVTLGNQDNKFDRLLKQIEDDIKNNNIKEKVIVQAGFTLFKSDLMEIHDYFSMDEFEELIKKCNLLITHGGVGSINDALKREKKVIAVARLKKYNEHTNDHQLQIIKKFDRLGYLMGVKDVSELSNALKKVGDFKPKKYQSNTAEFVGIIRGYIEDTNHKSWLNKYMFVLIILILLVVMLILK